MRAIKPLAVCGALVATIGGAGALAAGFDGFAPIVPYAAGTNPNWLASGDFDRDGDVDLVTSDFDGDGDANGETGFSVLLNNGDGTFAAPQTTVFLDQPDQIVAARIDADNDIDLVIGTLTGQVLYAKGDAGATFGPVTSLDTDHDMPRELAVADVNGDGRRDVIADGQLDNVSTVLIQRQNGSFTAKFHAKGDGSVVAGRLNNDAGADFVIEESAGAKVLVYVAGRRGKPKLVQTKSPAKVIDDLALADLNRDHRLDLIVADGNPAGGRAFVSVLPGKGNGRFGKRVRVRVAGDPLPRAARRGFEGAAPRGIVVADFDRDGVRDIAVALKGQDKVSLVRGKRVARGAPPAFRAPRFFDAPGMPEDMVGAPLDAVAGTDLAVVGDANAPEPVGILLQDLD